MKLPNTFFIRNILIAILIILTGSLSQTKPVAAVQYDVVVSVADANTIPIPRQLWGVNLQAFLAQPAMRSYPDFLNYLTPAGVSAMQRMGITAIRFPGGSAANVYNWNGGSNSELILGPVTLPYMTITDGLTMAQALNAELIYQANLNSALNQPGSGCKEVSDILTYPAHVDQAGKPRIRHVELGHDQWLYADVNMYQQVASECSQVIKAIDPGITIGLTAYGSLDESPQAATRRPAWNRMLSTILPNSTCGTSRRERCFDYVTDRIYPRVLHSGYTPPFLGQTTFYNTFNMSGTNPNPIDPANRLNPIFINQAINPSTAVAFTEWNLACARDAARGTPIPATGRVEQGVTAALMLFSMAQERIGMAAAHDLTIDGTFTPESGCGLLAQDAGGVRLSAMGQAFALTAPAAGGLLLDTGVGVHNSLLAIQENLTCTARDCLDLGAGGVNGVSNLRAYSVRQTNDMYVFLVNRDAEPTNFFAVRLNYNPYPGFTPTVTITADILTPRTTSGYRDPFFDEQQLTLTPSADGQVIVPVPGESIVRVTIAGFFLNAPSPTPTPVAPPNANLTEIIRLINSKRPPVKTCSVSILPFLVAVTMYLMVIHFAIGMNQEFKIPMLIMCFAIGGVVGYFLCSMTGGFMLGVFLSLFLW